MKRITFDTPEGKLIIRGQYAGEYSHTLHPPKTPDQVARMAERILLEQAKIPFDDSGMEDSAGRGKLRRMKASELVSGAFDLAEAFMKEMDERGHSYNMPTPDEIDDAMKNAENKN